MTCTAKESWKQAFPFLIAEDICKLRIAVAAACERKTQGEAAEVYASYGVPVFPCDWRLKKQKDGLKKVSKGPLPELGKGGLYLATADLEQVRSWWQRWPDALIGVPMGRRVGIWAVDVDHKDAHAGDGIEAWYRLEVQHGSAGTRSHLTGTNGLHHFYLWNSNNPIGCSKGKLPPGMEVKGEGGYVIFPPSPYVREGKAVCYSVSNDRSPEPAPPWLYDLILGKREGAKGNGGEPPEWPDGVRPISIEGVSLFGINPETNKLYWDGKEVVVRDRVRLGNLERILAVFVAIGTFGAFLWSLATR